MIEKGIWALGKEQCAKKAQQRWKRKQWTNRWTDQWTMDLQSGVQSGVVCDLKVTY